MPVKIIEVRLFEHHYMCDAKIKKDCDGVMLHTGEILQGTPPRFKHVCNKCRDVRFLERPFPSNVGLPVNTAIPDDWHDKLDREHVNMPPPEKSKIQLQ